ncbi:MAG: chromosome segregation ATPase [Granulosicoccus sp.]|jgi:chromosome segregation ATPase
MPSTPATPTPGAPGRPGLSFEAYERAYQELTSPEGAPPSQRQLRKFLGTGNNNTLAKYRRRIAEERMADERPPEAGSLDAELLATVQRLATQIALDEAQVAEDRVEEIRKDAEQRIRIAVTTMEKRLLDTALLEHRATTAEAELAQLRKTVLEKEAAMNQLIAQHQTLNAEHVARTQALDEMTQQRASLNRERDALQEKMEATIKTEKAVTAQSRGETKMLNQQLVDEQRTLGTVTEKHAGLVTRFDERNTVIETLNEKQQALQQRLDQAIKFRNTTLVKYDDIRHEHAQLKEQFGTINATLAGEQHTNITNETQYQNQLADKDKALEQLHSALNALTKAAEATNKAKNSNARPRRLKSRR